MSLLLLSSKWCQQEGRYPFREEKGANLNFFPGIRHDEICTWRISQDMRWSTTRYGASEEEEMEFFSFLLPPPPPDIVKPANNRWMCYTVYAVWLASPILPPPPAASEMQRKKTLRKGMRLPIKKGWNFALLRRETCMEERGMPWQKNI